MIIVNSRKAASKPNCSDAHGFKARSKAWRDTKGMMVCSRIAQAKVRQTLDAGGRITPGIRDG